MYKIDACTEHSVTVLTIITKTSGNLGQSQEHKGTWDRLEGQDKQKFQAKKCPTTTIVAVCAARYTEIVLPRLAARFGNGQLTKRETLSLTESQLGYLAAGLETRFARLGKLHSVLSSEVHGGWAGIPEAGQGPHGVPGIAIFCFVGGLVISLRIREPRPLEHPGHFLCVEGTSLVCMVTAGKKTHNNNNNKNKKLNLLRQYQEALSLNVGEISRPDIVGPMNRGTDYYMSLRLHLYK